MEVDLHLLSKKLLFLTLTSIEISDDEKICFYSFKKPKDEEGFAGSTSRQNTTNTLHRLITSQFMQRLDSKVGSNPLCKTKKDLAQIT